MQEGLSALKETSLESEIIRGGDAEALILEPSGFALSGKILRTIVAIAIALASFFVVAPTLSSPEFHAETIATLDEKKANVVGLAAVAAAASAGVELIPNDVGNSLAAELADLSSDFGIILVAILLEKYLLTVLALVSFRALVPVACILYALGVWRPSCNAKAFPAALKMALLAIVLVLVVPASAWVSQVIDNTFETSAIIAEASNIEQIQDAEAALQEESIEEKGWWESFTGFVGDAVDTVTGAVTGAADWATAALGNLLEAFAVMVITSCVVPILVIVLALWAVNLILGVDTSGAMSALKGRVWRTPMRVGRNKIAAAVKPKGTSGDVRE